MPFTIVTKPTRAQGVLLASAACTLLLGAAPAAQAAPLTLYAAGSLNIAFGTVAANFAAATGTSVVTTFGPSGTLRQQIEAGARPNLFASADTSNPLALQAEGLHGPVVDFAGNNVVAVTRAGAGVTSANLLATLLNPAERVATSTPVLDPLGDYDEQVFANADALVPGAKAALDEKAERLVAGPTSPPLPAGQNDLVYFVDTTNQADLFLTYATDATAALALDPNLTEVALPADLAVSAEYGETIINGAAPGAAALENYVLSPAGQAVLAANGFSPPTAVPEPGSLAVLATGLAGLAATLRQRPRSLAFGWLRSAGRLG